jgi:PAS domain S-box-containing protein
MTRGLASNRRERFAVALGAGIALAIAALDIALGEQTVLIGVLVLAPLVTAMVGSVRSTAVVYALSVATGLALGCADDFFGSSDHLLRLASPVLGGAVAIWVAHLRTSREAFAAAVGIQYSCAHILSEAETLELAAPRLVEAIASPYGWSVGNLWEVQQDSLRCIGGWQASTDTDEFQRLTHELRFERSTGLPGRVWDEGRAIWIPDIQREEHMRRGIVATRAGLHTGAAFPILSGNGFAGVIEVFSREIYEPDQELLDLMAAVGIQVGDFISAQRSKEAMRASEALKSAILASTLDCVITIDHEGRVVEFNDAAERVFGHRAEEAVGRDLAELIIPPHLRERHRASLRRVVEGGEPSILGRRVELTGLRADGTEFPIELSVNQIAGASPPAFTGTVRDITDRRRAEEERDDLLRLEQLARMDATQARDQLEAILRGVADAVTAQSPDGKLLFANQAAAESLGYRSPRDLLEAPIEEIMAAYQIEDDEGEPFPLERLPGRRALLGEDGAQATVRFRYLESGEVRWSLIKATPIRDAFGKVTMAINVIEDVTEHKRTELEQRFLADSSRVLGTSLDPDDTLRRIATLAVPEIADWCTVDVLTDDGGIERVALAHRDPDMLEMGRRLAEQYPPDPSSPRGIAQLLRTGESLLLPVVTEELIREGAQDEEHYRLMHEFGFRSAMAVPMVTRGRIIGAITFVTDRSGRRFDERDLALAEELSRRCATAVDNARLFAERAHIAKTLQDSLLPVELPEIPGLDTAARFRPTGEGNDVGGDFYDLFETHPQGWTIVVGDVCGKGPDAAAITALARYTLRAAAMHERLPSRSLRILNEALLRQRDDRRFCTVAYAYLEPNGVGTRVGFASGGHPLPFLLRADGSVERLGSSGTLLGVVPDPRLEDRTVMLAPGDMIVFYTDGVTDARGGALSEEALADLLASCAGETADAVAARVEHEAVRAQGGTPHDDIAIVVVRVVV